jgi:predicted DsbA family dithiol-disulfide isomerase
MQPTVKIDFVSDVVCPWCIIGYKRLEKAMRTFEDAVAFELHWHPFELNPAMPEGGENLRAHLAQKYGTTLEGSIAARKRLTEIGAELGFTFNYFDEMRMYNTFKAHQLLHWAQQHDRQTELHLKLFSTYFSEQKAVDDPEVLVAKASQVGLDGDKARERARQWAVCQTRSEIPSKPHGCAEACEAVPAIIFNEQYLISGAQPTAVSSQPKLKSCPWLSPSVLSRLKIRYAVSVGPSRCKRHAEP